MFIYYCDNNFHGARELAADPLSSIWRLHLNHLGFRSDCKGVLWFLPRQRWAHKPGYLLVVGSHPIYIVQPTLLVRCCQEEGTTNAEHKPGHVARIVIALPPLGMEESGQPAKS